MIASRELTEALRDPPSADRSTTLPSEAGLNPLAPRESADEDLRQLAMRGTQGDGQRKSSRMRLRGRLDALQALSKALHKPGYRDAAACGRRHGDPEDVRRHARSAGVAADSCHRSVLAVRARNLSHPPRPDRLHSLILPDRAAVRIPSKGARLPRGPRGDPRGTGRSS